MVFALAHMILKDKRWKSLKEDFVLRNRSKIKISRSSMLTLQLLKN